MSSHLEPDVDNVREDLKVFLSEEANKGFGADALLCVLYEAVHVFEDVVKDEILKSGKDQGMGVDKFLDMIKEKALKNADLTDNWE